MGKSFFLASCATITNLGLLSFFASNDNNANVTIKAHTSLFTGLAVMNLRSKSVTPKTMGLIFIPFSLFGNYLSFKPNNKKMPTHNFYKKN